MPDSLDVVTACATVSGTVRRVKVDPVKLEVDILVEPDRDNANYIDPRVQRFIIVKVVPTDQPSVTIPQVDEHASFFGAWVIDRRASATGTRELYPAWLIRTSAQAPAAPARNILGLKLSAPASVEVGSPLRMSISVSPAPIGGPRLLRAAAVARDRDEVGGDPHRHVWDRHVQPRLARSPGHIYDLDPRVQGA